MTIYNVYIDLGEGASPDDYTVLKRLILDEFRVGPITPVGEIPVYFSPVFSPLAPIPLRERIERRIKERMRLDHPIIEIMEIESIVID